MKKRSLFITLIGFVCVLMAASLSLAADSEGFVPRWSKEITKKNDLGANMTVRVTYYSAEYIDAVLQGKRSGTCGRLRSLRTTSIIS